MWPHCALIPFVVLGANLAVHPFAPVMIAALAKVPAALLVLTWTAPLFGDLLDASNAAPVAPSELPTSKSVPDLNIDETAATACATPVLAKNGLPTMSPAA